MYEKNFDNYKGEHALITFHWYLFLYKILFPYRMMPYHISDRCDGCERFWCCQYVSELFHFLYFCKQWIRSLSLYLIRDLQRTDSLVNVCTFWFED